MAKVGNQMKLNYLHKRDIIAWKLKSNVLYDKQLRKSRGKFNE